MATDQPDFADGVMLALYPNPDLAEALAVPGGLPAEELHVTVAYLGKADQVDAARLRAAADMVTDRDPIEATISGHARFTGGPKGDVIVALIDSPQLELLRRDTVDALTEQGVPVPADHGYTAHMTLAYVGPDDPDPVGRLQPSSTVFPTLSVVHGTNRDDLLLSDGLAVAAREAYATGWAASGGPMTDRVRAGCVAAVEMALEHAHEPGILEATLKLGHLEGTWAAVYHRREKVHASNEVAILAAIRRLHLDRHSDEIVRRVRRRAHLTDEAGPDDWLAALVQQLADAGLTGEELAQLRASITDALTRAQAEGQAAAMAVSADQVGAVGFSFDLAFDHAYDALQNAAGLAGEGNAWLTELLGAQADEVGATLSQMIRDGATAAEMDDAVAGILTGADSRALTLGVDLLTSRAMSQGAMDLYRSEGVEWVDFITAGDQRVCTDGPNCAGAEADSPYRLTDAPIPGLHPLCRCTLAATVPLPGETLAPFLGADAADLEELDAEAELAQAPIKAAAGKSEEEKKATRAAARERYRQIAAREPVANLAAELDQLATRMAGRALDDADVSVLEQAVSSARQAGMTDEALAPVEAAIRDRDMQAVNAAAQQTAADEGLSPIGHAGEVVSYDPALHEPLAEDVTFDDGQRVQVWKQGHTLTLDGDTIRLDRAIVRSTDEAETASTVPANARPYHLSLDGIEDLAQLVADAAGDDVTVETLTGGSTGTTYRVKLPDGRSVVHKGARTSNADRAKRMADAEQASSLIGRAIGLRVPAVYRDEADAVWMEYLDQPAVQDLLNEAQAADRAARSFDAVDALKDRLQVAIDSDAGNVAGLFDMMIADHDRNIGNWLLGEEAPARLDELPLIDHGNAFAPMWTSTSVEPPFVYMDQDQLFETTNEGPFARHYVAGEVDSQTVAWAENNLTPVDIAEVRSRLADLRPEFDLLGLTDWLDYAGRVLDTIEPYATGTRNLIAEEGA